MGAGKYLSWQVGGVRITRVAELVDMDHILTAEVRLEPTPGHTTGHVSVHISSRGEEAVITGGRIVHAGQAWRFGVTPPADFRNR